MRNDKITYIVGNNDLVVKPLEPFADIVCEFLNELSMKLRRDNEAVRYSDIMSLAFWCRKGNIDKLKSDYKGRKNRIGRGLAFHITPSNVPINFAFSYFFGLLSGNSNVVRIPSKDYPQINIICRVINEILESDKYVVIRNMTVMITYERDDSITSYYSSICDSRIIWGGDATIKNIRSMPIMERAIEVVFADRYSMCIIDSNAILNLTEEALGKLAEQFYNDSYLMDQNACSTPYLVLWYGSNDENKEESKNRFWEAIYKYAKKYDLSQIKAVDKYTQLCRNAIDFDCIENIRRYDNILYVVSLEELGPGDDKLRGRFGLFYEYSIENLSMIKNFINKKTQTLSYFGMDKNELLNFVLESKLQGIDRIVPIGSALDMDIVWDGYDIIESLSRVIAVK